ncbi:hypothetical protein Y032_0289g1510 [Ancylostoma ceylanicum]|nr:hypothetical protein Y032_0289g1510 [Ancylostoma ceylanicum]
MLRWGAAGLRCAVRVPLFRATSLAVRPALRVSRFSPSAFRVTGARLFSSSSNGDGEKPAPTEDDAASMETAIVEGTDISGMSTINVPDVFPIVPLLAINRYPLFPGFIKKVDIVKDDALKQVIRNRIALKQPYVGVFVKQDDENKEEIVTSLSQVFNVGCFAQV